MLRLLLYLLTGLVTSFFLFPFNLPFPGMEINTKMILAAIGVVLLVVDRSRGVGPQVSRSFFDLSLLCILISIWAFGVTVWNDTNDYAFAKYVISVWVWFGAAYSVVWLIRTVHGDVTVERIGNYLAAVCVVQCLLAYSMAIWPEVAHFVNNLMGEGHGFMGAVDNRLYGLGAALDPAGLRFSGVLVIITYLTGMTDFRESPGKGVLYFAAFVVIAVIGNMIARSTTIGMLLSILLFIWMKSTKNNVDGLDRSWLYIGGGLLLAIVAASIVYRVNPIFRVNLRFGFEGFFSLFEKGRWETHSTDILKGMIHWPESLKTWFIGDGYFGYSMNLPDRFGQVHNGYYMSTDIGYLRYIFYFGVIGLIGMIAVFVQMTATCVRKLPGYTAMFLMLLLVNLIGWFKVSSDIIMVFAPFVILAYFTDSGEVVA